MYLFGASWPPHSPILHTPARLSLGSEPLQNRPACQRSLTTFQREQISLNLDVGLISWKSTGTQCDLNVTKIDKWRLPGWIVGKRQEYLGSLGIPFGGLRTSGWTLTRQRDKTVPLGYLTSIGLDLEGKLLGQLNNFDWFSCRHNMKRMCSLNCWGGFQSNCFGVRVCLSNAGLALIQASQGFCTVNLNRGLHPSHMVVISQCRNQEALCGSLSGQLRSP